MASSQSKKNLSKEQLEKASLTDPRLPLADVKNLIAQMKHSFSDEQFSQKILNAVDFVNEKLRSNANNQTYLNLKMELMPNALNYVAKNITTGKLTPALIQDTHQYLVQHPELKEHAQLKEKLLQQLPKPADAKTSSIKQPLKYSLNPQQDRKDAEKKSTEKKKFKGNWKSLNKRINNFKLAAKVNNFSHIPAINNFIKEISKLQNDVEEYKKTQKLSRIWMLSLYFESDGSKLLDMVKNEIKKKIPVKEIRQFFKAAKKDAKIANLKFPDQQLQQFKFYVEIRKLARYLKSVNEWFVKQQQRERTAPRK